MRCSNCKADNASDAFFCHNCGERLRNESGWLVYLLNIIGVAILMILIVYCAQSYNENSLLRGQVNQLQSGQNTEITNLRNKLNSKEDEITNLKSQVPQRYKVTVKQAKLYHKDCDGNYIYFNCNYISSIVDIYTIADAYGLSSVGWIKMSDLSKN
jgi:hypothetical protein